VLESLAGIPDDTLAADDRLNRDLFARQYRVSWTHMSGASGSCPSPSGAACSRPRAGRDPPFATARDFELWIARLNGLDTYVDQTIDLMRDGMRRGLVQPRIIMERVPAQIAKQVVTDPTASPFYAPFDQMPASIPAAEQERLARAARQAIEQE